MLGGSADSAEVVIVGGGLIGCAIALELARRGVQPLVVERDRPGRAASWAGAGMLSPVGELAQHPTFLTLARASLAAYPAFVQDIAGATRRLVEFGVIGKLEIAFNERELTRVHRLTGASGVHALSAAQARQLEPALSDRCLGGAQLPEDAFVDNRALGEALWQAARARGVQFRLGETVRALRARAGRVTGVQLNNGNIAAPVVVIAAGAWSETLQGLPRPLPVAPVRGQMIALQCTAPLFSSILESERCYMIPRAGGRVLVGATVEKVGFDSRLTTSALETLRAAAAELVPELVQAKLAEHWLGFRPGTPDDLPVLGPDPEVEGLFYATGHFRNGILLTPITGTLIADLIEGQTPDFALEPFAAVRFAGSAPRPAAERFPVRQAAARRDTLAGPFQCDVCAAVMYERHCRIICPECGYQRDCSDP
jgi:glycine oxidase